MSPNAVPMSLGLTTNGTEGMITEEYNAKQNPWKNKEKILLPKPSKGMATT